MFDAVFSGSRIRNYRDSISCDVDLSRRLIVRLRERGVFESDNKKLCFAHP
jgi:hypothetical protein